MQRAQAAMKLEVLCKAKGRTPYPQDPLTSTTLSVSPHHARPLRISLHRLPVPQCSTSSGGFSRGPLGPTFYGRPWCFHTPHIPSAWRRGMDQWEASGRYQPWFGWRSSGGSLSHRAPNTAGLQPHKHSPVFPWQEAAGWCSQEPRQCPSCCGTPTLLGMVTPRYSGALVQTHCCLRCPRPQSRSRLGLWGRSALPFHPAPHRRDFE